VNATPYQIGLLQHTLGLNERRRESYRNHFVAGNGHSDMPHLEALERAGLMERRPSPRFLDAGDIVFAATDAGHDAAIAALPEPRKRTKADDWRDRDGCESFGEFLCGDKLPKFERRRAPRGEKGDRFGDQHRMFRMRAAYWSDYQREIEGDWCPTMKEAKVSYKAKLKAFHARAAA
jgi:hypothetical protein